jgi:hypothetical protein
MTVSIIYDVYMTYYYCCFQKVIASTNDCCCLPRVLLGWLTARWWKE